MKSVHDRIDEERFWDKVDKSGDCWQWTAGKDKDGYGQFKVDGRSLRAHRVSCEISGSPVPTGLQVDHMCHNTSCVKPEHLQIVTNKQNTENRSGAQSNSKSGVRGVCLDARSGRWRATVNHGGKQYHVGAFLELVDAEAAVIAKRNELFTNNRIDRIARSA